MIAALCLTGFAAFPEEGKRSAIAKPEDATQFLSAESRRNLPKVSRLHGVTMEQSASLAKLLGEADPNNGADPKSFTPSEANARMKTLEAVVELRLKITELLLTSEPSQKKKFVESCYYLESALIKSAEPDFRFSDLPTRQQANINYLLDLLSDDHLFIGLPYEGIGRTLKTRLNKSKGN